MYSNIVVAYDDSEFSKAALLESLLWIKRHGGKAVLVHAVFFDAEEFLIAPQQREKRFELGKKICYQTKEKFSSDFGLDEKLETLVCEGEPHEVIVDIASERDADLISMGTYGRKGFKKLFMGTVTSRVIVSSPCDILIVKKPHKEYLGQYKSILLSYDGSEFSKKALERACELSKVDGSEITALYVIPQYEEMLEFFVTSGIKESLIHDAQKILQNAKEIASSLGVVIKTEIAEGHAAEKIVEIAERLKSDLIIRGPHGWSGINKVIIGSIIENVIVNAPCPVLVVK
jgi:nucleotide-binding universal stress UspA family protein